MYWNRKSPHYKSETPLLPKQDNTRLLDMADILTTTIRCSTDTSLADKV